MKQETSTAEECNDGQIPTKVPKLSQKFSQPSKSAQIQLIPGYESKKSLEIYQHISLDAVEQAYQDAVQSVSI